MTATSARRDRAPAGTTAQSLCAHRQPNQIPPPEPRAGRPRPRPGKRQSFWTMRRRYPSTLRAGGILPPRPRLEAGWQGHSAIHGRFRLTDRGPCHLGVGREPRLRPPTAPCWQDVWATTAQFSSVQIPCSNLASVWRGSQRAPEAAASRVRPAGLKTYERLCVAALLSGQAPLQLPVSSAAFGRGRAPHWWTGRWMERWTGEQLNRGLKYAVEVERLLVRNRKWLAIERSLWLCGVALYWISWFAAVSTSGVLRI